MNPYLDIYHLCPVFYVGHTPFMAKLSDRKGRRFIYLLDVALFGMGLFIIAFSPSLEVLLVGRAIQGFGAGHITSFVCLWT